MSMYAQFGYSAHDCASAVSISVGQSWTLNTCVPDSKPSSPSCGTSYGTGGQNYFTFIGTGNLETFETCGGSTNYDTKLSAFIGTCGSLTCVTGNDDACSLQSRISFLSIPGERYYVMTHGFLSACGTATTTWVSSVEGDYFVDPLTCNRPNMPSNIMTEDFSSSTPVGWSGDIGSGSTGDRWNFRSGFTSSSSTGPSGAFSGTHYAYYESSSPATTGSIKNLNTATFTLAPFTEAAQLSFYYHMHGANMGILRVFLSTDGGATYPNLLLTLDGEQHEDETSPWTPQEIDLTPWLGQGNLKVRFQSERRSSFTSDMAIDLVSIDACAPDCSVQIDNIEVENESCPGANDGKITVTASTAGTAPLEYSNDGGSTWQSSNMFSGLAPGTYEIRVREEGNPDCFAFQFVRVFAGVDRIPPTFDCNDITVGVDENGQVTITYEDIATNIMDNCGIDEERSNVARDNFNCIDVGSTISVTVSIWDVNGNVSRCRANVTVEDLIPPVFTKCPMNTTFSLDPGLCDIVFNFDVEAIDNCATEAKFLDQTGGQPLTLFNLTCGFGTTNVSYLRVYQGASGECVIDSVISGVSQATGSGNMNVNVYEYNGAGLNFGNFNFVGGDSWFVPFGTANTLHTFEPNAVVSANTDYVIETVARSSVFGGVFVGLNPNGETEPTYVACGGTVLGDLDNLGFTNGVIQYVHGRVVVPGGPVPVIPDPGNQYAMGDALPIGGPYKFKFEACDAAGNCSICEFEVLVEDYYDPITELACNDLVQVSLDENCEVHVGADLVLEGGPYSCYDNYLVEVYEGYEPFQTLVPTSPVVTKAQIGKHLTVKVMDPTTGNVCWSRLIVEDKLPPQLECVDTIVTCAQDLDPSVLGWPVPAGATIVNVGSARCPIYIFEDFDNCGRVELTYKDWVSQGSCAAGYDRIVTRTWTAVDESGNESECTQTITVTLSTFRDVGAPCNFDDLDAPALMCDNRRNPDLDLSGHINVPGEGCVDDYLDTKGGDTLDDLPLDSLGWNYIESGRYAGHPSPYSVYYDAHPQFFTRCACWGPEELVMWFGTGFPQGAESCFNIQFAYEDTRIELSDPDCDAGEVGCYKLLRQWTIIDWCTGEIEGHNQIIKIMDKEGPEIIYPDEVEVGMDVWSCEGTWDVPAPWITDNCSNDTRYEVEVLTGNVSFNGSQWRVSNLAPGEHTAYITAYDCCGNATTHEITLDVVDNVPPVCVADAHTILSLSGVGSTNQNGGFSKIFAESFDDGSFDNCGPVWFKAVRMVIGECDEINGDDDPIRAGYQEYPDDYVKFCCDDVGTTVMVRFLVFDRDPGVGPVSDTRLRPNADLFGHYTECMVEVEVQDKTAPTLVPPPTIVVSCDFWFDINAIDDPNDPTFGRVVTDLADREKVKTYDVVCPEWCEPNLKFLYFPPAGLDEKCDLYDPIHPETKYEHLWGFDGYAISTCGAEPRIIVNDQRQCGQGRLIRTFTVPGANGVVTATQTIFFVDCNPYYINDENCFDIDPNDGIVWPCDAELQECEADVSPDVTGRPEVKNEDNCSLVAVQYVDELFDIVPDACFKILRRWTVLDWCQYDPSIGLLDGRWEYVQIILVNDSEEPTFEICEDVTFCDANAAYDEDLGMCLGYAELPNPGSDECTPDSLLVVEYKIDAFNDGDYDFISSDYDQVVDNNPFADDESNAKDASGNYPLGTHRIKWFVEDMCGNLNVCEYLFTVEDCKQPTPYCRTGIITVVMPSTGSIEVWASDLDIGSFDNCPGDLSFSFDADGNEPARTYTCDSLLGESERLFVVRMYVTDQAGNKDYCVTTIRIQDSNGACDTANINRAIISGSLATEDAETISEVEVRLYDDGSNMMNNVVTAADGEYAFANIPTGSTYNVDGLRDDDPTNGVSTKDLVRIQKHLLGIEPITSPYKLIAADVNNDQGVSAKDLLNLRKLVLGVYSNFNEIDADQTSWRFIPQDFVFANPSSPWPFEESHEVGLIQDEPNRDFVGVKIGDIDGNAKANNLIGNTSRTTAGDVVMKVDDANLTAGSTYRMDVTAANFADINGYQATLHFDAAKLSLTDIEAGALNVGEANFGMHLLSQGVLTTSWNAEAGTQVSADEADVLFTLVFAVEQNTSVAGAGLKMSSKVTAAEAYNAQLEDMGLSLEIRTAGAEVAGYSLYQNTPNPFATETVIGYELPEAMEVTLTVYDVTGKILVVKDLDGAKGFNEVSLKRSELGSTGVMYYQLDAEDFTATKRMIIIE